MVTRFSLIENQGSEAEVLRNGGGGPEGSEKEASAKSSMAYIQLEKQKERLNEALVRCAPSSPSATLDLSSAISDLITQRSHLRLFLQLNTPGIPQCSQLFRVGQLSLGRCQVSLQRCKLRLEFQLSHG